MTTQLIQAIVLSCQLTNVAPAKDYKSYKRVQEYQRLCVLSVGVCMRNKEIEHEDIRDRGGREVRPVNEGLDLLNCIQASKY